MTQTQETERRMSRRDSFSELACLVASVSGMGLAVTLTGCEYGQRIHPEYSIKPGAEAVSESSRINKSLNGNIVKVQPSTVAYIGSGVGHSSATYNHEFIYVIVSGSDGKNHTLIYPYSKAIPEGKANLEYRALHDGFISSSEFVQEYVRSNFHTDDVFNIEAEGIILPRGISYTNTGEQK